MRVEQPPPPTAQVHRLHTDDKHLRGLDALKPIRHLLLVRRRLKFVLGHEQAHGENHGDPQRHACVRHAHGCAC
tara:strand:+ start:3170 stop:3391 length:222 start_codon:yes stop_codon:yes gene_type:complete